MRILHLNSVKFFHGLFLTSLVLLDAYLSHFAVIFYEQILNQLQLYMAGQNLKILV